MQRLNFTLDKGTVRLLEKLSRTYGGNKSQTVRAALEFLAAHQGSAGWVIKGYTATRIEDESSCHTCGETHSEGEVLYMPVFELGEGAAALKTLPSEVWLDCPDCVKTHIPS
ncbi:MAG: hypothetical protein KDD65_01810 [Bacteroidetes bacterium]|nr:hypothetical protein [Bacteroidota bacterium]